MRRRASGREGSGRPEPGSTALEDEALLERRPRFLRRMTREGPGRGAPLTSCRPAPPPPREKKAHPRAQDSSLGAGSSPRDGTGAVVRRGLVSARRRREPRAATAPDARARSPSRRRSATIVACRSCMSAGCIGSPVRCSSSGLTGPTLGPRARARPNPPQTAASARAPRRSRPAPLSKSVRDEVRRAHCHVRDLPVLGPPRWWGR